MSSNDIPIETLAGFVDRDVAVVQFHRHLFEEFADLLRAHPRLRMGHFFLNAMTQWWFDSLGVAVRRLLDRDSNSISLHRLLVRVRMALDQGERYTVDGEPLTVAQVEEDLAQLEHVTVARAKEIVDRLVAHRDKRGTSTREPIWRGDFHYALDVLEPLWDKYIGLFIPGPDRLVYLYYEHWKDELFAFAWGDGETPENFPCFTGAQLMPRRQAEQLTQQWERLGFSTLV